MTEQIEVATTLRGHDVPDYTLSLAPRTLTDLSLTQLSILACIERDGPLSGTEVVDSLTAHEPERGSDSAIRNHLLALRASGFVDAERNGPQNDHTLTPLGRRALRAELSWLTDGLDSDPQLPEVSP